MAVDKFLLTFEYFWNVSAVQVKSSTSTCEQWIKKINMYIGKGDKILGARSALESLLSINGSVQRCPQVGILAFHWIYFIRV